MIYIVQQDLFNIEELKRVETEETVKVNILESEIPLIHSSLNISEPAAPIVD